MNDLDYLNQISAGVPSNQKTSFLDKKMKIVLGVLGGVILLLIILISAVGNNQAAEPTTASELSRLYLRSYNLSKSSENYNKYLRSSSLRSSATSFYATLIELSTQTSNYLENMGVKSEEIVAPASDNVLIDNLNSSLENARLNGILDRNYASEMYFQIRYLVTLEETVIRMTTDASLKTLLTSSKDSLLRLQEAFYNFSESK